MCEALPNDEKRNRKGQHSDELRTIGSLGWDEVYSGTSDTVNSTTSLQSPNPISFSARTL